MAGAAAKLVRERARVAEQAVRGGRRDGAMILVIEPRGERAGAWECVWAWRGGIPVMGS
jgi:hypothetical protein